MKVAKAGRVESIGFVVIDVSREESISFTMKVTNAEVDVDLGL